MPIKPGSMIVDTKTGAKGWLSHYTHEGKRASVVFDRRHTNILASRLRLSKSAHLPPARPRKPEPECSDEVRRLAAANGLTIREALEALRDE